MHTTPFTLLQRLRQQPSRDAWERLVRLYTPLLSYWLKRAGVQSADAEDVVQEVFVILLQKLPEFSYDWDGSFRSWLRTVTLNKLRDRLKRRTPDLLGSGVGKLEGFTAENEIELFVEDEYRRHVAAQALRLAQEEFAPATWQACWEHVVRGRPAPEVGRELGMTPGAVYAAAFRVLGRLRRDLEGLLN